MLIEKKLGEGAFAVVYLALLNNQQTALKIPKNNISKKKALIYSENEIYVLNLFKTSKYIVNLIHFELTSEKNHIFVELLGCELRTVLNLYKMNKHQLPVNIVKRFSKQILSGASEMATCNILHNDLKPENILFTKPLGNLFKYTKTSIISSIMHNIGDIVDLKPHAKVFYYVLQELILSTADVKIIDFGNVYTKKIAEKNIKTFMSSRPTRYYISPEILLKSPHWLESDMWSIGCIIYEMLTGSTLFNPSRENDMGVNSSHLLAIIETCGQFNKTHLEQSKKRKRYFNNTVHKFNYLVKQSGSLLNLLQNYDLSKNEYNFLIPMFNYDIKKRITPVECLKSSWLKITL
jgi:serine/threonine-protein kinase SRPK3